MRTSILYCIVIFMAFSSFVKGQSITKENVHMKIFYIEAAASNYMSTGGTNYIAGLFLELTNNYSFPVYLPEMNGYYFRCTNNATGEVLFLPYWCYYGKFTFLPINYSNPLPQDSMLLAEKEYADFLFANNEKERYEFEVDLMTYLYPKMSTTLFFPIKKLKEGLYSIYFDNKPYLSKYPDSLLNFKLIKTIISDTLILDIPQDKYFEEDHETQE